MDNPTPETVTNTTATPIIIAVAAFPFPFSCCFAINIGIRFIASNATIIITTTNVEMALMLGFTRLLIV